ncbi:hypothetical protein [Corynebacterium doosanense]|uniref:Head-to-tail stopper n=1 Tax=Corynebacterium doosanense CAU 212 = DSM 45436 TaxID=558173 RepID=A0A097IDH2_9CORY|nr:hypothetical protein [Corynebacterium doosanense]AIT60164.1 hypothetical protein CDOO_01955 [Corynebacterium doosanense CAU 212 = DSM 45436]
MIFTENVTIIRARLVRGDYGGQVEDWENPEEIPVGFPVSVQPQQGDEQENGRSHHTVERYRLYTQPPNLLLDLRDTDRIRVDTWGDMQWEVQGKPLHWRTEFLAHSEVDMEVIRGTDRN